MDLYCTAVADDDAVNDGQSETRTFALRLGGKKRLEGVLLDILAHADAIVAAVDSCELPGADSEPPSCLDIDE